MRTTTRRRVLGVALAATVALTAAACGDDSDDGSDDDADTTQPDTDTTGDDAPDDTDGDPGEAGGTLIAGQGAEPDRFDPHLTTAGVSFQVLENVYDTLVQPGDDLSMEPALATDWTLSDDQLTWTFTLRDDVTFHNGRPLTADDVVFSLERIRDPEVGSGASFRLDNVDTVTAVDDTTVEITVTQPTPNLLTQLGGYKGMAIIAEENVDDIDTAPIGTGPFVFESYSPGDGVVLTKNDDYWQEGLPLLDSVEFRVIPDPTVLLTNLETGDVDWIDDIPPADLDRVMGDDDIVVGSAPAGDYHYFALNQERAPFDDVRVRQAIAMAIDREDITEAATFGAGTPNQAAIPEGNVWFHEYAPYEDGDLDGAMELLEDAGVADGFEIEFLVSSEFPETVTQAEVLEAQLSPLGIDVVINSVDFSTWLDLQGEGEFDAFMLSWINNLDPEEFYFAQHHSDGNFNFQGQSNPELDDLLEQARAETDEDARKALYDQVAEIVVDDASYIYLYNPLTVDAWSPRVQGYETYGHGAVRFHEATVSS